LSRFVLDRYKLGRFKISSNDTWEDLEDSIFDVGAGPVDTVYVITSAYLLGQYLGSSGGIEVQGHAPRSLMKVDVDIRGNPWVLDIYGNIYQSMGEVNVWRQYPWYKAKDIGASDTGAVWILNTYGQAV